jgi:hypothetical protein
VASSRYLNLRKPLAADERHTYSDSDGAVAMQPFWAPALE